MGMTRKRQEKSAGLRVPDHYVPTPARRSKKLAVGTERQVDRSLCVSGKGAAKAGVPPIPDFNLPFITSRKLLAIRTERHDVRRPIVLATKRRERRSDHFFLRQVPHIDFPVGARGGQELAAGVERNG